MSFKLDVTWVGPTCVCVGGWEREREWVGPTSVCVCVKILCVCERERERENILSFNYVGLKTLSCC